VPLPNAPESSDINIDPFATLGLILPVSESNEASTKPPLFVAKAASPLTTNFLEADVVPIPTLPATNKDVPEFAGSK
jgi:hypothetical protein